ncbi:phosphoribosyl-AMP cyclohydrolase [Ancylobacter oerskovii]|uniref:Phosphoribosyl-AMP cyclohydrolase n=1 Tax=Ancylobacter oerskovii TaxID=459519 RepID=A0ABW4Z0M4_9HYPH|nr:phosphoribosyl-AMP cyclohydrolase [Ancylobacter oerskovii]
MSEAANWFAAAGDKAAVEEGDRLSPKFDADGLITAVAVDVRDGAVLMLAHMNAQALALTIASGFAHYYSRSRRKLWKKGEESGHLQKVVELRIDCDQDAVLMRVEMAGSGAACHTGHRSCFFRSIPLGATPTPELRLVVNDGGKLFDPQKVYGTPDKTDVPRF